MIIIITLSAQEKNFNKDLSSVRSGVSDTETDMEMLYLQLEPVF